MFDIRNPRGIDIHPITGWLFVWIPNTQVAADSDCDISPNPIPEADLMGPGILAMHPRAPQMGMDPVTYEGSSDWIIYHNQADCLKVWAYPAAIYQMLHDSVQTFCWDETG